MRTRRLGKTALEVPVMMLGGNVFGWTANEEDSFRLLDRAFDLGLTSIDTADVYSRWVPGNTGGDSETIIGKWFARSGKRDKVVIATKVGMDMGEGRVGLSPKHIQASVEDSLRRLQTDRIDLYQSHKDDESTPLEETLGAYEKLIQQGKVRYIGASNYTGARLRKALALKPAYVSLQPQYNLVEREGYETDLAPVVAESGIGVIPYYGLASGFLSGKYRRAADIEGKARARGAEQSILEREGLCSARSARCRRGGNRINTGRGSAGMAGRATGYHGTHCQRDDNRTGGCHRRSSSASAQRRRPREAERS